MKIIHRKGSLNYLNSNLNFLLEFSNESKHSKDSMRNMFFSELLVSILSTAIFFSGKVYAESCCLER